MRIDIYKTGEIIDCMWNLIVEGYIQSFEDHFITKEELIEGYTANGFGYSYHSICSDGDKIIAFNSIIPYWYYDTNEPIKLGLSGTTFVLKEYRQDIFIFQDMYVALKKHCVGEGMIAFLGVPNKNSYQYSIKLLKCKEICKLSYYVLPIKVFNILGKEKLSHLNFISIVYAYFSILFNLIITAIFDYKEVVKKFRLSIDETFLNKRFANSRYKSFVKGDKRFTYVLANENGVKTAYIMDFRDKEYRKSSRALLLSVWHILRCEKVDIIMYVGTMNMKQALLTKLPHRFDPKILPLTYNLLDIANSEQYQMMSKSENWDFSLINLDVR